MPLAYSRSGSHRQSGHAPTVEAPPTEADCTIPAGQGKATNRSWLGRWLSNFVCGTRTGAGVYGSPSGYRPMLKPASPLPRKAPHRHSLHGFFSRGAPQVVRSATFDGGPTRGGATSAETVPAVNVLPGRTVYDGHRPATLPKLAVQGSLKNSKSSIISSARSTANGFVDRAPRSRAREVRPYSSRETRDILRSMVRLADKRRLAGQHVHRHGRLVCSGINKNDLAKANIRIPLAKSYPWLAANYSCGNVTGTSSRTATTATPAGSVDYPSPGLSSWATPIQKKDVMANFPKISNDVIGVDEMTLEDFERGFYRRNTM